MSEAKYTPGPWTWRAYYSGGTGIFGPGGEHVGGITSVHDATEQDEANTQLQAAAPDMLDALHEAEDFLLSYFGNMTSGDVDDPQVKEVLDAINKAIRKATEPGESDEQL